MAKISKLTMLPLILLAVCAVSQRLQAVTSIYVFDPDQSIVVKTGGFAGVHETYAVAGLFQLTVDSDTGVASFETVDANLIDETGSEYGQSLTEIFNMTGLAGTIIDDMTIEFEGKTADGTESDVRLELSFSNGPAHLTGKTTPPPNSADMFFYDIDAITTKKYAGGTGEPNEPYQIATAEDLMLLGDTPEDYDKHFILTADIDLDPNLPGHKIFDRAIIAPDMNDATLSFEGTPFTGVFDGNGHTISHLTITGGLYLGLFGKLDSGAKISNLGLEAVDVNGAGDNIGGLVGCNYQGSISISYSTGTVRGNSSVGGLVGDNSFGIITKSHSTCEVRGERIVGGLLGSHGGSDAMVGGILINCYSTGMVTGTEIVGGLVGVNGGIITTSCSTGMVIGDRTVGGLVGNYSSGIITTSYSTGTVTGDEYVGGLVGHTEIGIITTSYSTGTVTGDEYVGGLVGHTFAGIITTSYSTGTVDGNNYVGGLIGDKYGGTVAGSFWDIETSEQTTSAGGTGKTTAEMQDIDTFLSEGWDFVGDIRNGTCDYWQISPDSYPRLRYPVMPEGLGTAEQPYLIRDANDLGTILFEPLAHYRLEMSVDLTGITWSMAVVPWFGGTFDGKGHVISNLNIQGIENLGLFGRLGFGAKISDLGLESVDINGIAGIAGITAVGGLVGSNDSGSISTCYSNGTVNGTGNIGGLVGSNSGTVSNCNSTGSISGTGWYVGGLVGSNGGNISNSYSTGTTSGEGFVGGLVGSNYKYINNGSIAASYSTGTVSGNKYVGGLVGGFGGPVYNSFWDVETSGQWFSAGGTGKTTAEMQTASTFLDAGWDFVDETANGTEDIWWILEGQDYPRLWWEAHD